MGLDVDVEERLTGTELVLSFDTRSWKTFVF